MQAHADIREIGDLLLFSVKVDAEIVRCEIGHVMALGIGDHGVHLHARGRYAEYNFGRCYGWRLLRKQERCTLQHAERGPYGSARVHAEHLRHLDAPMILPVPEWSFQDLSVRLEW